MWIIIGCGCKRAYFEADGERHGDAARNNGSGSRRRRKT